MKNLYFLKKRGYWYAHNSYGYTENFELAEIYSKEYALQHAAECSGVVAVPVVDVVKDAEHAQHLIDRLAAMKDAVGTDGEQT